MSWEAIRWARSWRQGELSSPEKFVLFLLAEHYNDTVKRAWPSMTTLARETELDRRTVARAIAKLEEKGFIEIERWFNPLGSKIASRYCLPWFDSRSTSFKQVVAFVLPGAEGALKVDIVSPRDPALMAAWTQFYEKSVAAKRARSRQDAL